MDPIGGCANKFDKINIMKLKILDKEEVALLLRSYPEWVIEEESILAEFNTDSFEQSIDFIKELAQIFEGINHHPKMIIEYKKVTIISYTHDAGNKITNLDMHCAELISNKFNEIKNTD